MTWTTLGDSLVWRALRDWLTCVHPKHLSPGRCLQQALWFLWGSTLSWTHSILSWVWHAFSTEIRFYFCFWLSISRDILKLSTHFVMNPHPPVRRQANGLTACFSFKPITQQEQEITCCRLDATNPSVLKSRESTEFKYIFKVKIPSC